MKNLIVDVLITTFNSEKYIKDALNSVLNQSYKYYKIIIVDDCSSDNTYKICNEYKKKFPDKISIYKLNKNSSSAAIPRNFGIKKCKNDYIAFLDSDDIWHRDKLKYQVLKINKSSMIYFTNCKYFEKRKIKSTPIYYLRILLQIIFTFMIKRNREWLFLYNPIAFSSALVDKKIFTKLNFDKSKNFVGIEDLGLWFNYLKEFKSNIIYVSRPLVYIRRRTNSLHSNYNLQTIKSINLISNLYLNKKNFININIFLLSIAYKAVRPIIKKFFNFIKLNLKFLIVIILILNYLIFYSPLFKFLGNKLIVDTKSYADIQNIIVYSGPEWESYTNRGYKNRFEDLKNIIKTNPKANFYFLGRAQVITEQRILKSLLISEGINQDKITVIYEDLGDSSKNLGHLYKILKKNRVNEAMFVTSPYLTKRVELLWKKYNDDLKINFYKTIDWPSQNYNFFEKFDKKNKVIYEYSAILHNYFNNKF